MITRRVAAERGQTRLSWLESYHSFSFADYYDPEHMGFRRLRVINDDKIAAGGGFSTHSHRDMEIVTWVVDGALEHKDSLGNGSIIRPGDAQRMSAGTGISHSEFNHSKTAPVHLLQIWILPDRNGLTPGYEQRSIAPADLEGQLRCIAAADGRDGAVTVHQDCQIYVARLAERQKVAHVIQPSRYAWVQVARGELTLNGESYTAGDGAAVTGESALEITSTGSSSEVLLFDLA